MTGMPQGPGRVVAALALAAAGLAVAAGADMPHPVIPWDQALAEAAHPADYARILEDGPPETWDRAAIGVLGERESVDAYALPVVLARLPAVSPGVGRRVCAAIARHTHDPRAVPLLDRLASGNDPELAELARAALDRIRRRAASASPEPPPPETAPPAELGWPLVALLLVAALLSFVLFVWGLRLLGLRRLVQGLPPSAARSIAVGPVALHGEAQPLGGRTRVHPDTGEVCVHHDAGGDCVPFCVVDDTGAVAVDPTGAVLLSADGVIVPGERVHVVGLARRARPAAGERAGIVTVGAPDDTRSAFGRVAQFLVGAVMGGVFGRGSARMLFSDPLRCYWIWDDLHEPPFTRARDTVLLVAAFMLSGAWLLVFFATAVKLFG